MAGMYQSDQSTTRSEATTYDQSNALIDAIDGLFLLSGGYQAQKAAPDEQAERVEDKKDEQAERVEDKKDEQADQFNHFTHTQKSEQVQEANPETKNKDQKKAEDFKDILRRYVTGEARGDQTAEDETG